MSVGFVAELLIAYHDPDIKPYSIAQRTGPADPASQSPTSPSE
jgi:hypothetical protein